MFANQKIRIRNKAVKAHIYEYLIIDLSSYSTIMRTSFQWKP